MKLSQIHEIYVLKFLFHHHLHFKLDCRSWFLDLNSFKRHSLKALGLKKSSSSPENWVIGGRLLSDIIYTLSLLRRLQTTIGTFQIMNGWCIEWCLGAPKWRQNSTVCSRCQPIQKRLLNQAKIAWTNITCSHSHVLNLEIQARYATLQNKCH